MTNKQLLASVVSDLEAIRVKLDGLMRAYAYADDQDQDLDLDLSKRVTDQDHDHDQDRDPRDDSLITKFSMELDRYGLDYSRRDLHSVSRNISYYFANREKVKSPAAYLAKILAGSAILPEKVVGFRSQQDGHETCMGYPITEVDQKTPYCDQRTFDLVVRNMPSLARMYPDYSRIETDPERKRIITALAMKQGVL